MSLRMRKLIKKIKIKTSSNKPLAFGIIGLCMVIGVTTILMSHAATPNTAVDASAGTLSGCATKVSDSTASSGSVVRFGNSACGSPTVPYANAGAHLTISYSLSSLSGTLRYVATNGSDTYGNGTVSSPYATISKAYSVAANGDSIVIRGGTYRNQGNLSLSASKSVTMIAYPGELPIFNGAQAVNSGWTTEGSYQYIAYTPRPVTNGSGITFTSCQNLNTDSSGDCPGKYPDQAWQGSTQLQQVTQKSFMGSGKFWVDHTNNRLYMMASDVSKGSIEVSSLNVFMEIKAPNTTLNGFEITRYSNSAGDYGVINIDTSANNSVLQNMLVSETAYQAIQYLNSSNGLNTGSLIKNCTITTSNWMGVGADYNNNLTLDSDKITNMNQFNEFTTSPQSGALKTSRTRYTTVENSQITDNKSQGIWFDQSNYDVVVANNLISNNSGSGMFYEISDDLYLINNVIQASGGARAVKLSASSGLHLVNNTVIGGADPIGIYTDNRSIPGCSDPSKPLCANSYSSDRDTIRPFQSTITWLPSLDMMYNNIVAYPSSNGYCSAGSALCITQTNATATVPINTVIHQAGNGLPQTQMDGNVYANGSGRLIATQSTSYGTLGAFTQAMAGAPVNIGGLEIHGLAGNNYVNSDGTPTSALTALNSQAVPIPTDATINKYIPAGTKHYGVTYQ